VETVRDIRRIRKNPVVAGVQLEGEARKKVDRSNLGGKNLCL